MFLALCIAFLCGLAVGHVVPLVPLTCLPGLLLLAAVLTTLEHRGTLPITHGLLLFGGVLGGIAYWAIYAWASQAPLTAMLPQADPVRMAGIVSAPVRYGPHKAVIDVQVMELDQTGDMIATRGMVRLTWREPDQTLFWGDQIAVTVRLHEPAGFMNPGGLDYAAALRRHGIHAVATVHGPGAVTRLTSSHDAVWTLPGQLIDRWRNRIRQAALHSLTGDAAGLFLAMVIGEQGYLSQEIRDAFTASGTVHILSISGSHLGLLAALTFFSVKMLCRRLSASWLLHMTRWVTPTRLATLVSFPAVLVYTLLAGAEIATVRSLIMILVFLLAAWTGRTRHLLPALSLAAILIALHDPNAIFDISFQLSFCSVLAIALVAQHITVADEPPAYGPWTQALGRHAKTYGLITAGVTLATVPLTAYYFNQLTWMGIFSNVLIIPLAGFVIVPLGFISAVGTTLPTVSDLPFAAIHQLGVHLILGTVTLAAHVPGAVRHIAAPSLVSLALFYAILVWSLTVGTTRRLRFVSLCCLSLIIAYWVWPSRDMPDATTVRVSVLDVGQGDAILLELPDGQTVLIDGGASYDGLDIGRAVVAPFLWHRGITRLDHVIGTHPQLDHVGGLAWLVQHVDIGRYWSNGIVRDEPFYHNLRSALETRAIPETHASAGTVIVSSGDCALRVLHPAQSDVSPGAGDNGATLNNRSIVTHFSCPALSLLFAADVEAAALESLRTRYPGLTADLVKVPHHGARSSLDTSWIEQTKPRYAVISVGRRNSYRHPASDVLRAYTDAGSRILRTDRQGAILLTASTRSAHIQITTAQELTPRPIPPARLSFEAERRNLAMVWSGWLGQRDRAS